MKKTLLSFGLLLFVAVIWRAICVRMMWPPIPFFHGDSDSYLQPPFLKIISGEWHKGERTMQYLIFLYYTIRIWGGIWGIPIMQHILGIGTGIVFFLCFILSGRRSVTAQSVSFLTGIIFLSVYLLNPNVLVYEQMIAPESCCMLLMACLVLFAIVAIDRQRKWWVLAGVLFFNLYLLNPMPKFIISTIVIEITTIVWIVFSTLTRSEKIKAIGISHLLYILVILIPELTNTVDKPDQDRVNIEWKQMTYTHFDILMSDTADIRLPPDVKRSLMNCFERSKVKPYAILGFNSDDLMWGDNDANDIIERYFNNDKGAIYRFYKETALGIIFHHPLALTKNISRQICCFYIPNGTWSKTLYDNNDIKSIYTSSRQLAERFDSNTPPARNIQKIGYLYTASYELSGFKEFDQIPVLYSHNFFLYTDFDFLFLYPALLFLIIRFWQGVLFKMHIIYFVHFIILAYVMAVTIVHTLDIHRFVFTIFPLLLLSVFFTFRYLIDALLLYIKKAVTDMLRKQG